MPRKNKYEIAVYATYKRVVEVEAFNQDDAEELASSLWADDKIDMCPHDSEVMFDEVEFSTLFKNGKMV